MAEIEAVIKAIEELREKLNKLYDKKGTVDDDVIMLSQMLDTMLNEYQRLIKK